MVKLPTVKLQEMVVKSVKGASFEKSVPMTSMMAIQIKDGKLTLLTTDEVNYLYIVEPVEAEDFYVVINADVFSKLIAKMTSDEITLELTHDSLEITGNGTYKIELELDADGTYAKLPDPVNGKTFKETETINLSVINTILNVAKPSLMPITDIDITPCYTGYYAGDMVVATDSSQICGINVRLFKEDKLLSLATLNLVGLMDKEVIDVGCDGDVITFTTDNCIVYGRVMPYIDEYDIESITNLLTEDFSAECKIPKSNFMSALDRLSLFVSKYEKNQVRLNFTEDGIEISSVSFNAVEFIKYRSVKKYESYTCTTNISMLQSQLKVYDSDEVVLCYKNVEDNAIKFVDNNITQIIALGE